MSDVMEQLAGLGTETLAQVAAKAGDLLAARGGARLPRLCPARMLRIPDEIRRLSPEQADNLLKAFRDWRDAAKRPDVRVSRNRVLAICLVLRHTGARLGEVLSIDDLAHLDLSCGVVRLPGGHGGDGEGPSQERETAIPVGIARELAEILDEPGLAGLRGQVFALDQGFVRRKFSERGEEAGLPRDLANPSALRNTRAVELLQEGAPLTVVQSILGHSSAALTAAYVGYAAQDLRHLIHYYMNKGSHMRTSARNTFFGTVFSIRTGVILSEVVLTTTGGFEIVSVITNESLQKLRLMEGMAAVAMIKAPWIVLVKDPDAPKTSARNRLHGVIRRINEGSISAEVVMELADGTELCTLITDESVKKMNLAVGDELWAMFKAFSVILAVEDTP